MPHALDRLCDGARGCALKLFGVVVLSVLSAQFFLAPKAHAGQAGYTYDELGRLIQVVSNSGDVARYTYDAAGNIKGIERSTVATLAIADFTPKQGPLGSSVTVYGTGFSATPGNNVVKFNGVAASVTAAAATQLTVTVPNTATTGPISVTVGASTATSSRAFAVSGPAGPVPAIAGFSPNTGPAGTVVTITGTGFDVDKSNDQVFLDNQSLTVTSATPTQLQAVVPANARSGHLRVSTLYGAATSVDDFYAVPTGLDVANIVARGRIAIDGAAINVSALPTLKYAQYIFDGTQGQKLGFGTSSFAMSPSGGMTYSVRNPDGSVLITCNSFTSSSSCNIPALPTTGVYTLLGYASGGSATYAMLLSSDIGGALTLNSTNATTFSTARAGQNGRYTFDGVAGSSYSVAVSNVTIPGVWTGINVYAPDGSLFASGNAAVGYSFPVVDVNTVPMTGTYTVFVDPFQANTGQVSFTVSTNATGALSIDGSPTSINLQSGQNGRYTFSGTAGQNLGLGIAGLATTPSGGSVRFSVVGPTGTTLVTCNSGYGYTSDANCNLPPLPATGAYTVVVDPVNSNGASLAVTLSSDLTGTLVANSGSATTFNTSRPGQNGRYTFSGVAGKNYSLALSNVTIPGLWTNVVVYAPDGTQIAGGNTASGNTPPSIDINSAPATGTYTVFVDPFQAATGQLSMSLSSNAIGTLTLDGAGTSVSLLSGQNGRYTFSGTAGQNLGLGISGLSTTPSGGSVSITVLGPTGVALTGCNGLSISGNGSCNLTALPATGPYTVVVDPLGTNSGTLTLTLSSDTGGSLTVNATTPTTFSTTRSGQNGRYTFNGTAGSSYGLAVGNVTFSGTWTNIYVYAPDGTQLAAAGTAVGYAPPSIDIKNVPATGTYTVFVDPFQASTGQLSLGLSSNATGVLAVDGAAMPVSLLSGQNGLYTFSGTVGQNLGLGVNGFSTTPAGGTVRLTVLGPTGVALGSCTNVSLTTNGSCNLPSLPATGTYTVVMDPEGTVGAAFTLTLSSDIGGPLTLDGAITTFNSGRPGQNGRYTFSGNAGSNYGIALSNVTIPGSYTYVSVFSPNGTQIASGYTSSSNAPPSIDVNNVPVTGLYTIFVDPFQAATGQVSMSLTSNVVGNLALDGAPATMSLLSGQNARYTFSAAAGQSLGLGLSSFSTAPAGGTVGITVLGPTGVALTTCNNQSFTTNGNCILPSLPATGTYTVVVDPQGTVSAGLTLTLSTDVAGALTVDAGTATTFSTSRSGQNGRFSFSGTVGANYSLALSNVTFPGSNTAISVYAPDGSSLASTYVANGSPTSLSINNVPATGMYTVLVRPYQATTGGVDLRLSQTGSTNPASQTPNGSLAVDGAVLQVSVPSGQTYLYTFAGTQGQTLGLGVSSITMSPSNGSMSVSVIRPDNTTTIASCSYLSTGFSCNVPVLPSTGTYTVRIQPSSGASVTATLTLSSDQLTLLTVNNATPTVFSTTRQGQNARYSFSATAGQNLSVAWSGSTFAGSSNTLYVFKPDGTSLAGASFGSSAGALNLGTVPATGTYTVFIDPYAVTTGQVSIAVREPAGGALNVDGTTTAVTLGQGQTGRYTFSAAAGQTFGMAFTSVSTVPSGAAVYAVIQDSTGVQVADCSYGYTNWACNVGALPKPGTYAVVITPATGASASLSITASTDLTGTLLPDAASTLFSSTRAGQNGRYTFSAIAGENYTVAWSGSTLASGSYITVYKPDGTTLAGSGLYAATGSINVGTVPATGTYVVYIDPAGAGIGQVNVALRSAANGAINVDGVATAVTLAQGQIGRYTFSASAGQALGFGFSSISTSPANSSIYAVVYTSTGRQMLSCSYYADASCNLGPLPATDTYTLVISPVGTASAQLTITVSSDLSGALLPNAQPTSFSTNRPGQNGRYTFNAVAGDNLNIAWSGSTFNTSTSITVYKPDGSSMTGAILSSATGSLSLGAVPATGTYSVFVDPGAANTGQISLALRAVNNGTLNVDGAPTSISLAQGQGGRYTFNAAAGQSLGLGIGNLSTVPSGAYVYVSLYNSTGRLVTSCSFSVDSSCNVSPLAQTDTYTLVVSPAGQASASMTLTMSADITGSLGVNGAPASFSTTRPGQNGRYTFSALAGESYTVAWTDATISGYWSSLSIYKPDGTYWGSSSFATELPRGIVDLGVAPASGSYVVYVDPLSTKVGSVGIAVTQMQKGSLTVDATAVPVSLVNGQQLLYTFDGVTGANLGAVLSAVTTAPAAASTSPLTLELLSPAGTLLKSCAVGASNNLTCKFPGLKETGTYEVRVKPAANSATFNLQVRSTI